MSLKITLRPRERMIIGGAVVKNGNIKCELQVDNNVPILRNKDIMRENEADTPCRRIYFVIQLMYIDEKNILLHYSSYWELVRSLINAAPSLLFIIDEISEEIVSGRYYQALKLAKKLIEYEQEAVSNVLKSDDNL